jgi:RNA polymerase sigma factor (sigma-70 family)
MTDGQLLELFLRRQDEGAEEAFAVLVERHGPMVLRACHGVLRDPDDAQDVFQATFLVLVRKADSVRKRDSVGSWLFGVALRLARRTRADAARRRAREREGVERATTRHGACEPGVGAEAAEDCRALLEEIDRLPARYREPMLLCYLEGHTTEEAARRLGCPRGTVLSRLARARARLRERLGDRVIAPAALFRAGPDVPRPALSRSLVEATVAAASAHVRGRPGAILAIGMWLARLSSASRMAGVALALLVAVTIRPALLPIVDRHAGPAWGGQAPLPAALSTTRPGPKADDRTGQLAAAPAPSHAGGLDPAFGDRGFVVFPVAEAEAGIAHAVATQPDGKILLAAVTGRQAPSPVRLVVARFLADGAADLAFGGAGFIEAGFRPDPNVEDEPTRSRILVQPDGKILLASAALVPGEATRDIGLQRLHPDGTPDRGFGDGGVAPIDVGLPGRGGGRLELTEILTGLGLQPDGKIVAGGVVYGPAERGDAFFLLRLRPDGTLDEAFGDGGRITAAFPLLDPAAPDPPSIARALDLAIGPGGRIALAGDCIADHPGRGPDRDLALVVYGPSGQPDPSFGDGGRLVFDLGTQWGGSRGPGESEDEADALAFAPDGDLLVTGRVALGPEPRRPRCFLARFDPSGRLDPTFGDRGVALEPVMEGGGRTLVLRGDGGIIVGGSVGRSPEAGLLASVNRPPRAGPFAGTDFYVARFRPDGALDRGFGTEGRVRVDLGRFDFVEGLALRPDGTLVAAGGSHTPEGRSGPVLMSLLGR